ncbi:MAG: hypothetical protein EBT18_11780, partial [Gammaproteobacteria bacterium]|nr:hypothetical protein [Gammaproteobacteria bacterium]
GQTWSTPAAAKVKSFTDPILVFGGGWDSCLDADQPTLPLSSCSKGSRIYVVNALTGKLIEAFETEAPVVAEVSPLDIDGDGFIDFVYAADAAGNLYRLNFSVVETLVDTIPEPLALDDWHITHIAKSTLPGIRFLNKPTIGAILNRVFVTLGSGDRERPLKQNYPYANKVQNRFYALIDEPYDQSIGLVDLDKPSTDSERGMLDAEIGLSSATERLYEKHRGWYLDLPDTGEQIVNPAAIAGGRVLFNSFHPEGGTKGFCSDLGTSKFYQVPLFRPRADEGEAFGEGIPIPPIIHTVKFSGTPSCEGEDCGPGKTPANAVETVCIGCKGFDPIEIDPTPDSRVREAYRAEDIDRL